MLIIFDCDGVLRSVSWDAVHSAYLAIAEHLGRNPQDFWADNTSFRKWHDTDWHVNLEKMGMPKGSDYSGVNKVFHKVYDPHIKCSLG